MTTDRQLHELLILFLAMIGSIMAQLLLARVHDRQLEL